LSLLKWCLGSGVDVNSADYFGNFPLMKAIEIDSVEAVKLLLRA
jgi:ankyrin repeat protein